MTRPAAPETIVPLEAYITHKELRERYPWISDKRLGKWRSDGLVRAFQGTGDGSRPIFVYPKEDIEKAIASELETDECPEEDQDDSSNTGGTGSGKSQDGQDTTGTATTRTLLALEDAVSKQQLSMTPAKNSSSKSPPKRQRQTGPRMSQ